MYKVKQVAEMIGISVRTLHHYDHIGLLKPDLVNQYGYRFYSDSNLETLQNILFLKELDFPLQDVREIINNPSYDSGDVLEKQRELLIRKKNRLEKIIQTIDKTIASRKEGKKMTNNEMFGAFDMNELEASRKEYASELKRKYGSTDAYKESNAKTAKYTKEDWGKIMDEGDGIIKLISSNMDKSADHQEVQKLVGEWRSYITRSYYKCTKEILKDLGEMYVSDERFKKNFDKHGDGLAKFFSDAIEFYCRDI